MPPKALRQMRSPRDRREPVELVGADADLASTGPAGQMLAVSAHVVPLRDYVSIGHCADSGATVGRSTGSAVPPASHVGQGRGIY